MGGAVIQWSIVNWITIMLMVIIGGAVAALATQLYQNGVPGAGS